MTNINSTTCEVKQVRSIKIQSYSYIYGVSEFVTNQENNFKNFTFYTWYLRFKNKLLAKWFYQVEAKIIAWTNRAFERYQYF